MRIRLLAVLLAGLSLSGCSGKPKPPRIKGPPIVWNTAMQSIPAPPPSGEVLPPGAPWPTPKIVTEYKK